MEGRRGEFGLIFSVSCQLLDAPPQIGNRVALEGIGVGLMLGTVCDQRPIWSVA
jgi:hypothetical protein